MYQEPEERQLTPAEELRELQEEHTRLKGLKEHPGFKYYLDIGAAQIATRRGLYEGKPLKSLDESLEQEFQKGEVAGIRFMTEFVDIRLRIIEEQCSELAKEIEDASRERTSEHDASDDE